MIIKVLLYCTEGFYYLYLSKRSFKIDTTKVSYEPTRLIATTLLNTAHLKSLFFGCFSTTNKNQVKVNNFWDPRQLEILRCRKKWCSCIRVSLANPLVFMVASCQLENLPPDSQEKRLSPCLHHCEPDAFLTNHPKSLQCMHITNPVVGFNITNFYRKKLLTTMS